MGYRCCRKGNSYSPNTMTEMKALEADLVFDKHRYQEGHYYTAGYNSPWKIHHRFVLKH